MKRVQAITTLVGILVISFSGVLLADPYDDLASDLMGTVSGQMLTVAVAELETDSGRRQGRFIADEITEALIRAGVSVVERRNVERISEELSFQLSGSVADDTVAELGQAVGADCIVFGTAREFSRPRYSNKGIKIMVQLVSVAEQQVVSSASIEVEKSDMTSLYRRREYTDVSRYPELFEIRLSADLSRVVRYRWSNEDTSVSDGPGLGIGLGFLEDSEGFFVSGWDLGYNYLSLSGDDGDVDMHVFSGGKRILIRIPLWRYIEALPYLSHIYFGLSLGGRLSFSNAADDRYFNMDLQAVPGAGFALGAGESFSLFADYRYSPEVLTVGLMGLGSEEIDGVSPFRHSGHQLSLGVQLLP